MLPSLFFHLLFQVDAVEQPLAALSFEQEAADHKYADANCEHNRQCYDEGRAFGNSPWCPSRRKVLDVK